MSSFLLMKQRNKTCKEIIMLKLRGLYASLHLPFSLYEVCLAFFFLSLFDLFIFWITASNAQGLFLTKKLFLAELNGLYRVPRF